MSKLPEIKRKMYAFLREHDYIVDRFHYLKKDGQWDGHDVYEYWNLLNHDENGEPYAVGCPIYVVDNEGEPQFILASEYWESQRDSEKEAQEKYEMMMERSRRRGQKLEEKRLRYQQKQNKQGK